MRQSPGHRLRDRLQKGRVWPDRVGADVTRFHLTSRWTALLGFEVSAYLVGDILVDTGFAHVRRQVMEVLDGRSVAAVACTHNHEDHTGNCGPIAERFRCPVYLRHAGLRWSEGVRRLKPYRAWWWGAPGAFDAEEMPDVISDGRRCLRALPAPGHSVTHVALWEEATGTVFTGDLFISPGASAVMTQENPYDLVDSLRRVAAVEPALMLTGHGLRLEDPGKSLRLKADRVEEAALRAVELHREGRGDREIVHMLFSEGHTRDRRVEALTQGEFSRVNFVRAAVLHARES
ncbi:MAG: MBL fold metallo-hydrolase [Thermoanaerobaculales bacterium]|nr:MBL fold metallo-hydrolase [Thermoanaerobaculales bacterium]